MKDLVIITTTFYPSESKTDFCRADLALKTARAAEKEGYKIIFVDGGSRNEFLNELSLLSNVKLVSQKENGLGKARRQAFKEGYNSGEEFIIWTEPEKCGLIRNIPSILEALVNGADLVIPKRESMASYPLAQQYIELFCNLFFKEVTKNDLDMWFGPRAMKREIALYFINYNGAYGDLWDSMHLPVMEILSKNKKVKSVAINYIHDSSQTLEEEHDLSFFKKRVEQLNNLLLPIEEYWKKLPKKQLG